MNKRTYKRDQATFDRWMADIMQGMARPQIAVQRLPNEGIRHLRPHYTNEYFKTARTVYLAQGYTLQNPDSLMETVKGAHYNYSDRYSLWYDHDLMETARETAQAAFPRTDSAAYIEAYLRALTGDSELKLVHILAGFNVSNGFDYQVYGFIPGAAERDGSQ